MSRDGQSVRISFAGAGLLAALIAGTLAVVHAADTVRTPTGWRYFFGQASLPVCSNGHCDK